MKRILPLLAALCLLLTQLSGPVYAAETEYSEAIDMTKWQHNESADVYWQVGIQYCAEPADISFETLGVFVPGAYFNAEDNGDGTYTCTLAEDGTLNGYTAATAPILFPVNTAGHKSQAAPTGYSNGASSYTAEGFVYVAAGCRGKEEAGIPAGVTDLKSAIRYIRANLDVLPGSTDRVVAYGHSGGGSQSAVLGASGDSPLYTPYLEAVGAADTSDVVNAVMCWCPITCLDSADEGHEWSMGVTRTDLTEELQSISDALAAAYADYVNEIGFTDAEGNLLLLEESEEGIYQAGTYYEYVKNVIEESLEHYLVDSSYPITEASGGSSGQPGGGQPGGQPGGESAGQPGGQSEGQAGGGESAGQPEGQSEGEAEGEEAAAVYNTPQEYIDSLNKDGEWVSYDETIGEVTIASIYDFTTRFKVASKPVAAFDKLEKGGHDLFHTGDGECTHFDAVLAEIVKGTEYEAEFTKDLSSLDFMGNTMEYRLRMFSPLSYVMEANEDYGTAQVADHWRIRSGITQSDTPLTTELNLALGLMNYGVDVDFETVWAQGHTQAERTGSSDANFIAWLHEIFE